MKKINLMIVGAQKAATTSLKNYLGEHPAITTHPQIEFDYFVRDEAFDAGYETAFRKHFGDPAMISPDQIIVAKNVNMCSHPEAIERLKEHNPDCFIVFVVRNPVDRAYSSYSMEAFHGFKDDFSEIVRVIEAGDRESPFYRIFVRLGHYSEFVKTFLKYFGKDQVRIVLFEDFKQDPLAECQAICRQLKISEEFRPNIAKRHNQSRVSRSRAFTIAISWLRRRDNVVKNFAKMVLPSKLFGKLAVAAVEANKSTERFPKMDPETRKYLAKYFTPYNKELSSLTGVDVSVWEESHKTAHQ